MSCARRAGNVPGEVVYGAANKSEPVNPQGIILLLSFTSQGIWGRGLVDGDGRVALFSGPDESLRLQRGVTLAQHITSLFVL